MDTFDTLILSVFLLLLLPIVARLTFWKQNGQLLHVWPSVIPILLFAIAALTFCTVHHWNAPHRRFYQYVLGVSGVLVSLASLAVTPRKNGGALTDYDRRNDNGLK